MADIKVTVEYWQNPEAGWTAHAYGGPVQDPVDLTVTAGTEEELRAEFVTRWNSSAGTSWAPEEFAWVPVDGAR